MNSVANPFAGFEPNTTAGPEDLGSDFDLAGAAEKAARTGRCIWKGAIKERHQRSFPPARPGLASPRRRRKVAAEPEDPSTGLFRRVLAGSRELDVS